MRIHSPVKATFHLTISMRGQRATGKLQRNVPTHVVTLTQVGTSVYLGQTHLGTSFQVPAWVRKFSLGSTGDEISSLIIIQSLFVQQKFEY